MEHEADAFLLGRWSRGDRHAGTLLVERHTGVLLRFFRKRRAEEAEDLVQQTFLACFESARRFRRESSFRTFLIGIAVNQLHTQLRRSRKRREALSGAPPDVLDGSGRAPEAATEEHEERLLGAALERLRPDMRAILELFYWRGLSQIDVSATLGIPVGTVASRIRRARGRLLALMRESDDAEVRVLAVAGRS